MHISTAALVLSILALSSAPASAQLKKIRFSTTSIAVTELQFRIHKMKVFDREEGLDLETLLIRGSVGMQALIGGSVDYSSAAGSVIAAGGRGAPRFVRPLPLRSSRLGCAARRCVSF